ncbi:MULTISPECIES: septation ring formation regulator EzrA [Bacillaceae]|uniref:Septation ring formation regulator EzrA n=1 Tax=Evansella alkalicola TaxID=745819 RepID=A0ABS6JTV5_9BACI|nr:MULTISPECIES: septation ring formation regulator EzrA [Bacillaceae]MBU9721109.1 septation ring formation regulator EzrA [Bacillus alkalicola]
MLLNFIYVFLALIIIVILYGAWSRKRIYKQVDKLESKKIQLMNTPVTEELSKIKGLKMSGETEERFEEWREVWDEIVTLQLPDIEEKLFDIEELANKYRFSRARRYISFVDEELNKITSHIGDMVEEVEKLVESEQQNREEITVVRDLYDEVKKKLWAQKSTLSGSGASIERKLKELNGVFTTFEQQTEEGNYLQARELLLSLREDINVVSQIIDKVPQHLILIEKEIPNQLEELMQGLTEMEEDDYPIEHFSFKFQIKEMKSSLFALIPLVENLQLEKVEEPLETIQKQIDEIYEKLEHEAISRKHVDSVLPDIKERVERLPKQIEELKTETESVKLSYRISEEEDRSQLKIEKKLKDLLNKYVVIDDSIEEKKQTYTSIRVALDELSTNVEEVEKDIAECMKRLDHLRKDERSAEDAILELRNKLIYAQKHLKRSNLPGVPNTLLVQLDEAQKLLFSASDKLNEIPISMEEVVYKVDEAKEYVNQCVGKLNEVIEDAKLAESVIQYGNRYRRNNDEINIKLLQAEDCFRNYQYDEALEIATDAVKTFDPNVIENVKNYQPLQRT